MEAVTRRLFTVDEYHCMGEAGILRDDERVELIEGEIIEMSPIGGPHIWCVIRLTTWFGAHLLGRAFVSTQNPVRLSQRTEPEPDVVLLRPPEHGKAAHVPTVADVLLLIEVSSSSLGYDRGTKLPLYALAGIPEVWIVDLDHDRVEVYRRPVGGRYQDVTTVGRDGILSPVAFPDLRLPCADILPS